MAPEDWRCPCEGSGSRAKGWRLRCARSSRIKAGAGAARKGQRAAGAPSLRKMRSAARAVLPVPGGLRPARISSAKWARRVSPMHFRLSSALEPRRQTPLGPTARVRRRRRPTPKGADATCVAASCSPRPGNLPAQEVVRSHSVPVHPVAVNQLGVRQASPFVRQMLQGPSAKCLGAQSLEKHSFEMVDLLLPAVRMSPSWREKGSRAGQGVKSPRTSGKSKTKK